MWYLFPQFDEPAPYALQLVDTIKSLTKPEDMPQSTVQSEGQFQVVSISSSASFNMVSDIYDLSAHVSSDSDPSYVESLQGKVQATQQLITAFVQLAGKEQAVLSRDEVYTQCQRAQTQVRSLIISLCALVQSSPTYTVFVSSIRSQPHAPETKVLRI